jgi:hypothetical protein
MKKRIIIFIFLFIFISCFYIVCVKINQSTRANISNNTIQNVEKDTAITTVTTNVAEPIKKLELCSNKYFNTEYDKDGKVIIKDFPYKKYFVKDNLYYSN